MGTPRYIRFLATTDHSDASRISLEYCKALLQILPVRVIPAAAPGFGIGIWPGYEKLLAPIEGDFINCVSCGPDQWLRTIRLAVPGKLDPALRDQIVSSLETNAPHAAHAPKTKAEVIAQSIELWTAQARNILFPAAAPRSDLELQSAKKYAGVVVPTAVHAAAWAKHSVFAHVIPLPVETLPDIDRLAQIVTGGHDGHVRGDAA